ncbi:MAG: hypothetical protein ACR2OF_02345 [Hyphomicrobium sp.]
MTKFSRLAMVAAAAAVMSFGISEPAEAGKCFRKAASGTAGSLKGAKFQVYEALLQSFDWGVWMAWMTSGTTPGYKVATPRYTCAKGGMGYNCKGVTTICKTS